MILVDTSAWIEYTRATRSEVHLRLAELIKSDALVATTDPVTMEVLAGARDDVSERNLHNLLRRFVLLVFDPVADFSAAARIYRRCRRKGVTPRSLIDCMIVSVAMRHRAAVLAHDTDFSLIARVVALDLDPATRTE